MRVRGWLLVSGLAMLAACAENPPMPVSQPEPSKPSAADVAVAASIASHRQLAERFARSGDLAAAAREWHILILLAPADAHFPAQLDQTRAAMSQGIREHLQAGNAALRNGDTDRASQEMLKVLALDPENTDAMKALRDIDRQKLARVQNNRATRANQAVNTAPSRTAPGSALTGDVSESYDIDQRIEMFRAGDVDGGLHELRAFVAANPNNQGARNRIGVTVYERGREAENRGAREQALMLYEQAVILAGKPNPEWAAQTQKLRKTLSDEYYDKGMRAYRTDTASAIKLWETSLRYDPQNRKATAKLQEARVAEEKLKRIQQNAKPQ